MLRPSIPPNPNSSVGAGYIAVVVTETDKLRDLALAAVQELGDALRNGRAVKAAVKNFAKKIRSDSSAARVEVLEVVGFCSPRKDRPSDIEPIVLFKGKPVPVDVAYAGEGGDYWVGTREEVTRRRDRIIAALAGPVAENLIKCEAMSVAIHQADEDDTVSGYSCDPETNTVELDGDEDGAIAKRLPPWITVGEAESSPTGNL